jgi:hypothetical protein
MKESVYQAKILLALRTQPILKEAVIWKFSDRFNSGIPDFCVIWMGRTAWFEIKVMPRKLTPLQSHYLAKIKGNIIFNSSNDWDRNWVRGGDTPCGTSILTFDELIPEIVRRCVNS